MAEGEPIDQVGGYAGAGLIPMAMRGSPALETLTDKLEYALMRFCPDFPVGRRPKQRSSAAALGRADRGYGRITGPAPCPRANLNVCSTCRRGCWRGIRFGRSRDGAQQAGNRTASQAKRLRQGAGRVLRNDVDLNLHLTRAALAHYHPPAS